MNERPHLTVAVVMRREQVTGSTAHWQPWRWVLADVVPQASLGLPDDVTEVTPIDDAQASADSSAQHWLFPGFVVELFRDDVEGYYLNLSTPQPCFWLMWREPPDADALPDPQIATLSYHDAGRWLDAQERVDQVPAPPEVLDWLRDFVQQHYQPEPKRRKRPDSFRPLSDRFGNPVSISTDKNTGRGGRG